MNTTAYNSNMVSKSDIRIATSEAIQQFLARGGVIEECKPSRRGVKAGRMISGKISKGYVSGTSGFANGYPRKSGV